MSSAAPDVVLNAPLMIFPARACIFLMTCIVLISFALWPQLPLGVNQTETQRGNPIDIYRALQNSGAICY